MRYALFLPNYCFTFDILARLKNYNYNMLTQAYLFQHNLRELHLEIQNHYFKHQELLEVSQYRFSLETPKTTYQYMNIWYFPELH